MAILHQIIERIRRIRKRHRCIEYTQWSRPYTDGYGYRWQSRECTICGARKERKLKSWGSTSREG